MKKTIAIILAATFVFMTEFINPLKAQDAKNDMMMLAKNFENAYNSKDAKALQEMYTKDAVRVGTDSVTTNGNEAISASFATDFENSDLTISIVVDKAETQSDGTITAMGTYHVTGANKKGDKIDVSGTYNNTNVKEAGHWKISKSVLTKM